MIRVTTDTLSNGDVLSHLFGCLFDERLKIRQPVQLNPFSSAGVAGRIQVPNKADMLQIVA